MSFKSKDFYFKLQGDYALWTAPESKGGGEKFTYSIPTLQALTGIADSIYFKPTFKNIIDEVKVINEIRTETKGVRALVNKGTKTDLNYITYLTDPVYLIKFHFEWNDDRLDLKYDRNHRKHEAIMERSLKKGGRRDIFLGTRECIGYVDLITEDEYLNTKSNYKDDVLNFGIMFHSFKYPVKSGEPLKSLFTNTTMIKGVIDFKPQEECEIENILSDYTFKYPKVIKSVDNEFREE
jgi:CRISPR-associated protein Cas5d